MQIYSAAAARALFRRLVLESVSQFALLIGQFVPLAKLTSLAQIMFSLGKLGGSDRGSPKRGARKF